MSTCNQDACCCLLHACRYASDPKYTRALDRLDRNKQILVELLKKENLLRGQGELQGPCCGAWVNHTATHVLSLCASTLRSRSSLSPHTCLPELTYALPPCCAPAAAAAAQPQPGVCGSGWVGVAD